MMSLTPKTPQNINPMQWQQALGFSRQACARVFRDGGAPGDALAAFGLPSDDDALDWTKAVDAIAESICSQPMRQAA